MQQLQTTSSATYPSQEAIAQRAYEIFLARGGHDGNAISDWLQAERELMQVATPQSLPPATSLGSKPRRNRKTKTEPTV